LCFADGSTQAYSQQSQREYDILQGSLGHKNAPLTSWNLNPSHFLTVPAHIAFISDSKQTNTFLIRVGE
jgi:hypothetical protein